MSNKYISSFQYLGSSISSFKIRNDFIGIDNEEKLKHKLDVSHSILSIDKHEDEDIYISYLELNIKVVLSEGKKKYSVDLSMQGCFAAPLDMEEEQFIQMLKLNGISSLYSIARGFIQSTTSQTLVSGSIILPMFNVAAYSRDKDKQETD